VPRNVRNFWLNADIDGRRSRFASGPRGRDGGFRLDIYHREQGCISPRALHIFGRCIQGKLRISVEDGNDPVFVRETER
jgi:hypothetical protein